MPPTPAAEDLYCRLAVAQWNAEGHRVGGEAVSFDDIPAGAKVVRIRRARRLDVELRIGDALEAVERVRGYCQDALTIFVQHGIDGVPAIGVADVLALLPEPAEERNERTSALLPGTNGQRSDAEDHQSPVVEPLLSNNTAEWLGSPGPWMASRFFQKHCERIPDGWSWGIESVTDPTGYLAILPEDDEATAAADAQLISSAPLLLKLVGDFVDDDECSYDHDDACQTHNLQPRPCPHEHARALLGALHGGSST